jgi:hypothetical protein
VDLYAVRDGLSCPGTWTCATWHIDVPSPGIFI